MGPLVAAAARDRVKRLVDSGVEQGAELAVDGRSFTMQGYENGFFVGGCLFDRVTTDMNIYKEEVFGPVLSVVRAKDYGEALQLPMTNPYGNGTRSEEHTSELQSLMRISYAVFCLKKKQHIKIFESLH